MFGYFKVVRGLEVDGQRWESVGKVLHTSSYHFRAFAGRLYCFAFSLRSSTKEGKTASNFFFASWDDMMVEQGS